MKFESLCVEGRHTQFQSLDFHLPVKLSWHFDCPFLIIHWHLPGTALKTIGWVWCLADSCMIPTWNRAAFPLEFTEKSAPLLTDTQCYITYQHTRGMQGRKVGRGKREGRRERLYSIFLVYSLPNFWKDFLTPFPLKPLRPHPPSYSQPSLMGFFLEKFGTIE